MEAIIASIGGCCALTSSLGSVYIDRRNRSKEEDKDDKEDETNNKFHSIFNNIDFWIKSEIPNINYGEKFIQNFLIIRLNIIKKNLNILLNISNITNYDYTIRKLSELINGINDFEDIHNNKMYIDIPENFINKFNKWDNRSELILICYLKNVKFKNVNSLIYHFLNVYMSSLNSMINSLLSNLDLLMDNNKQIIARKRFKDIVSVIKEKTNLENNIKELLKNEKIFNFEKFLFRFDNKGIITYCSELTIEKFKYNTA